jgi:group I intron endonuclease
MITLYEYNILPALPGIYKLHDIESDRFYIGSSINLRKRIGNHLYSFKKNSHNNPILQALWNKDPMRFRCEILILLSEVSKETLLKFEQIQLDNSNVGKNELCMNVLHIAGSHYGRKRSPETVAKLREINRGRSPSAETREKMRQAKLGIKLTEEHKSKISNKGKKVNRPLGIKSKTRKLSDKQVKELRKLRTDGWSWKMLADKYNLGLGTTKRIALNLTYKDIL